MSNPNISICIPAYKNKAFLERLLDSIKIQSYKNFEVVITDDSPDLELQEFIELYRPFFSIQYFKNSENLNTPENWNEAVRNARFEWIKIMHDDDWFTDEDSLLQFAQAILKNPTQHFIFSAYQNVYFDEGRKQTMFLNLFWKLFLRTNPEILISRNVVGPPSATLYKKTDQTYDRSMKYVVDIDFYTSYMKLNQWQYISQVLINVGIHSSQVTKYTFGFSDFHFKESVLLLLKKENEYFRNPLVYDGWWRLLRNFEIKSIDAFNEYNLSKKHVGVISSIINLQNRVNEQVLKFGLSSKLLMSYSYIKGILAKTI